MVIIGNRVRATKVFSSRAILGMLLGWALAFEGFFALSIANSATIEGIGGIKASTFSLAATQLVLLGAFISIVWVIKAALPEIDKRIWGKLLSLLTYLGMALIILEGLIIVFNAGDVVVTNFGKVSKIYIVLTGAQLFALGGLSLRLWRLRNVQPTNWLMDSLGSFVASLLMAEGLIIIGMAAYTKIKGLGGVLEQTVYNAGVQLFLIGALIFILWIIVQDPWFGQRISKILAERKVFLIVVVLSCIIAIEGVLASTWSGDITIEDVGGIRKMFIVAGCAQLFALGALTPLLWKLRLRKLNLNFLPELFSPLAMVVLATEGVVAMGLAASTRIDGIGGIKESTFFLAGEQLLILSLIGLLAFLLKDSSILRKRSRRIVISLPIISLGIVGLEGIAATVLAAQMWITDFSSVREQYVLLVGLQMAIISVIALASWARSEGMTFKFKATATGAAAFVVLMLPIAILI
ncbi:MAG: hypothetical protein NT131_07575 [Methanomassiliicoccales archaeon]|nr:hypothetical protein [Methanomassiliicoccales archaeon]